MGKQLSLKAKTSWLLSDSTKKSLATALAKHITPDKFLRVAMNALVRDPDIADCTKESLWLALLDCGSMGLMPDVRGSAYLVPFNVTNKLTGKKEKICTFIPGYRGLMDCARRDKTVKSIQANIVREGDVFEYEYGSEQRLKHIPSQDGSGKFRLVYAYAKLDNEEIIFVVLNRLQVESYRQKSKAKNSPMWTNDWEAGALKTAVRRLCNWLPYSEELSMALEKDEPANFQDLEMELPVDAVVRDEEPDGSAQVTSASGLAIAAESANAADAKE